LILSREHLPRYLDEFDFRYNRRHLSDSARTMAALAGGGGQALTYRETTA
jgi:hypothetical protein